MKYAPKSQIELFHLMFLRQLNSQIDPNLYSIKDGCNLRFFFDSVRYFEDLDIDVAIIQKQTLENKINKILSSSSLLKLLRNYEIEEVIFTAPKQTQTTQRWKIKLKTKQLEMPLHTKIEFSRRQDQFESELSAISVLLCQCYHLQSMRFSHYAIQGAVAQKILALAHRSLTQARDVLARYFK